MLPFDSMSMSPKEASKYLKKNTKFKFFNKLKLNKQRSKRDVVAGEVEEMEAPLLRKQSSKSFHKQQKKQEKKKELS